MNYTVEEIQEAVGDRYPFTDKELRALIQCYQAISSNNSATSNNSTIITATNHAKQDATTSYLVHLSKFAYEYLADDVSDDLVKSWGERVEGLEVLLDLFNGKLQSALQSVFVWSSSSSQGFEEIEQFLESIAQITGRRTPKDVLNILFQCCCNESLEASAEDLVALVYKLTLADSLLCEDLKSSFEENRCLTSADIYEWIHNYPMTQSLKRAMIEDHQKDALKVFEKEEVVMVKLAPFVSWAEKNFHNMWRVCSSFLQHILFRGCTYYPVSSNPFSLPNLCSQSSAILLDDESHARYGFIFSCMSQQFACKWHRVYSTDVNGNCFNRFQRSLLGYGGPSVMIIRSKDGFVFGAFTAAPWKESANYFGTSDCFLFALDPFVRVYYPNNVEDDKHGQNFMYFNSKTRTVSAQQGITPKSIAYGCGFGGNKEQPRLFITESFEHCLAGSFDSTFETGPLTPSWDEHFDIDVVEVWGVGGDVAIVEGLAARNLYWDMKDTVVNRAKSVDRRDFVEDLQADYSVSKTYEHRKDSRGRHEFQVDEKHGGYYNAEQREELHAGPPPSLS